MEGGVSFPDSPDVDTPSAPWLEEASAFPAAGEDDDATSDRHEDEEEEAA